MPGKLKRTGKIITFNIMRKIIAIVCAVPALLAGCSSECIQDSGKHVVKDAVVKNFDQIKITGAIKLVIKQDSSYAIKIDADSSIVNMVRTDVSSGELRVKLDDGIYCGTDSVVVYAGIGELKKLNTVGAVKVVGDGRIYATDVDLKLEGTSDVSLDLSASKLTTRIDGIGKLALTGQTGVHNLTAKGTSTVNAFDFVAGIYDINIDGTGKANINVLNDLKIKTAGSSEVYYKGNPKNVDEKKSGATKLEKVN